MSLRKILRFCVRDNNFFSQSRCLSLLLLAMSSRVYLFFPPLGHEPPPTLRDSFNPHPSLQRRRKLSSPPLCQTPECRSVRANRSTLSPSHPVLSALRTLKVSEHDSLCLAAARRSHHSGECPRPQKKLSRAQRCTERRTHANCCINIITTVGVGKKADCTIIGPWDYCLERKKTAPRIAAALCRGGLSAVNAIGTHNNCVR